MTITDKLYPPIHPGEVVMDFIRGFGIAQNKLNLQSQYDLDLAEGRAAEQIAAITPLQVA
ncbi:hypothetical protein GC092_06075 [Microbacterium sp. JZ37]|nr:hypothetical protein [Microbacterium sp. JZ37]WRH17133.1 hypothetical protein GC092_06075 [Microbacterium sp. JZ37]